VSFGYFWDGFCHFLVCALFVFVFIKARGGRENLTWEMLVGLIIGSSSLFFLPNKLPFLSRSENYYYQFWHYPISDWDILLLGGPWHRFFITHSAIIPTFLLYGPGNRRFALICLGLTIGISSHLAWDAYSSANPLIVFYPKVFYFKGFAAELWLYVNTAALLLVAEVFRRRAATCH
jgi:hypothetical protein